MAEQIPLPDRLMVVRQQIAALQAEEKAIREALIADPTARLGNLFRAEVRDVTSYRVRGKDLEKADPAIFARIAREVTATQVFLLKRPAE